MDSMVRFPDTPRQYADILRAFTQKEKRIIAMVKRFIECFVGDRQFRLHLNKNRNEPSIRDRLRQIVIDVNLDDLFCLIPDASETSDTDTLDSELIAKLHSSTKLTGPAALWNEWSQYECICTNLHWQFKSTGRIYGIIT